MSYQQNENEVQNWLKSEPKQTKSQVEDRSNPLHKNAKVQEKLNQTTLKQKRSRTTEFKVDSGDESPFDPENPDYPADLQIHDPFNPEAMRAQMKSFPIEKRYKTLFNNTQDVLNKEVKALKSTISNHEATIRKIESANNDHVLNEKFNKNVLEKAQKEVKMAKEDLEKLKVDMEAEKKFHREVETQQHSYKELYITTTKEMGGLTEEVEDLRLKNHDLAVSLSTKNKQTNEMASKIKLLEKNLGMSDCALNERFKHIEDNMTIASQESKVVVDQGIKVKQFFADVQAEHKSSNLQIEKAHVDIETLIEKVANLEDTITRLEVTNVASIESKLTRLNTVLTEDLLNDIEESKNMKLELATEKEELRVEQSGLKTAFQECIDQLKNEYSNVREIKFSYMLSRLPGQALTALITINMIQYIYKD